jgi:cysteinyl-tRNA synthetase
MTLRIYNTLTRTKEEFKPLDPKNVRMYVCGPTVYDFAHIGNARPAIVFDVMYQLLRHLYGPEHVTYVRNITDVDDKINARALRDHHGVELNDAIRRVTETTYDQYQKDVAALGCLPPTHQPRATEHISGMVDMIRVLINRGHAYEAGGEVLFSVGSMADYGKLSGRKLEDQQAGARVAVDAHKKNPGDFVLWKQSSDAEPGWPSPWGRGRPGWHIECSVMSKAHLGEVFDIHGGGLDLIFPHHENEIAQSRCAHGTETMARYWMHNGFLQVEGKKMSKSDGNFVTISELLETEKFGGRRWDGQVLRLAMLMTNYREPLDFSVSRLLEAKNRLERWHFLAKRYVPEEGEVARSVIEERADDLNTSEAFHEIDKLAAKTRSQSDAPLDKLKAGKNFARTLVWLGLASDTLFDSARKAKLEISVTVENAFAAVEKREHLEKIGKDETWIDQMISARRVARQTKNWAESDLIRNELGTMGIEIIDVKDTVSGEMKMEWEVKR